MEVGSTSGTGRKWGYLRCGEEGGRISGTAVQGKSEEYLKYREEVRSNSEEVAVPQVQGGSGEYLKEYREDVGSVPWECCHAAYPQGNMSSLRIFTCRIPLQ